MYTKDIIDAFTFVANEKGINKPNLSGIIEELFISIIEKKYGEENFIQTSFVLLFYQRVLLT